MKDPLNVNLISGLMLTQRGGPFKSDIIFDQFLAFIIDFIEDFHYDLQMGIFIVDCLELLIDESVKVEAVEICFLL